MGSKKTRAAVSAVTYILISILAVICVFPFFWMLISALKPKDEIRSAVPSLLIDNPTIDNFRRVLVDNGFLTYIKNSFVVSLAATLISMIIAVLAGYALSRYYRKRIVKTSNFMMMLSQMIPGVLLLVPLYMIMQQMHMLETHISLVLAYTTFVIPLCTFMMSSFFGSRRDRRLLQSKDADPRHSSGFDSQSDFDRSVCVHQCVERVHVRLRSDFVR